MCSSDLISAIARKWVESWEHLETRMLPEIKSFLAEDFEFVCPGEPGTVPFIGTFQGAAGIQQWLDAYFSLIQRNKSTDMEYMVGENSVVARWLECGTFMGQPAPPVRINMHFQFVDGLIARIVDDYDTQTGATIASDANSKLLDDSKA